MILYQQQRHACIDQRLEAQRCAEHGEGCPDHAVRWYSGPRSGDHYGIPISPDAGGGYIKIDFCPFCGARLLLPDTQAEHALRVLERTPDIDSSTLHALEQLCRDRLQQTTEDEVIRFLEHDSDLALCLFSSMNQTLQQMAEAEGRWRDAFDWVRFADPGVRQPTARVRLTVNGVQVSFLSVMQPMLRQFRNEVEKAAEQAVPLAQRDAQDRLHDAVEAFCRRLEDGSE